MTSQLITQWLSTLSTSIPHPTTDYQGPESIFSSASCFPCWVVPFFKTRHSEGVTTSSRSYVLLGLNFHTGKMIAYSRSHRWLPTTLSSIEDEEGCHWTLGECARLLGTASTFPPLLPTYPPTPVTLERWKSSPQKTEPKPDPKEEEPVTANDFFFGIALLLQARADPDSDTSLHEARQTVKRIKDFMVRTAPKA